ncbi:restriction endonuclease subunit S [Staphylococcus nepalensis]
MTNEKNVPELRFPEFEGEWGEQILEDISAKITEKNKDSQFTETLTNSAEYGIISQRDFFDKDIANEKNLNGYYIVRDNDFVYNPRISNFAPVGPIKRNKLGRTGVMSPLYYVFRPYDIDVVFLEHYFESTGWHKFMKLNGDTGARADRFAIKDSIFKTMPIPYPIKEEQQIIGDFFSKLDRQIELEEQKLAKLEEQKKGYMQKIFSQELRFKDENGNDYPEWEDKLISDIGKVVTGNTPSKKDNDYWNSNQYVWVTPTDISNKKNIYTSGYQLSQKGFSKARQLPKNTLLITCIASIGKNAILRIEGSCNQQINAVIPNDNYDVDYLYYAFEDVSKLMKSIAGKTATQIVNKAVFEKLLLNVPIYEEQQKISGFLNKVDILIDKQTQKIDELKLRKQGFSQKMFV